MHISNSNIEMLRNTLLNFFNCHAAVVGAKDVMQDLLTGFQGNFTANKLGVSNNPI